MKRKMRALILSSLLLGGLIVSTTGCKMDGGSLPDLPDIPDVPVTPVEKTFTVEVVKAEGGSIYPTIDKGTVGKDVVSFLLTPLPTHDLETLKINGEVVSNDTRSFEPKEGVNKIEATFKEVRGVVTVDDQIANGTLSVDKKIATIGDEVTVSGNPEKGYLLDTITHNGKALNINAAGKAKFNVEKGANLVSGTFIEDETYVPPVKPTGNKAIFFKPGAEMRKDATANLNATAYLWGGSGPAVEWPGTKIGQIRHEKLTENVWMVPINFDMYENLIFTVNGEQTADISLADLSDENNMVITEGTQEGSFGKTVHSYKAINGTEYFAGLGIDIKDIVAPDKPQLADYGTYKVYFRAPEAWGTPETMGIHYCGTDTPTEQEAFPNSTMTKVEGETNLYVKELHMKENIVFKFATKNPDYDATVEGSKEFLETNDIKPTNAELDELGEDATVLVTLDDKMDGKLNKYNYVPGEGGEIVVKHNLYFQDAPYWHTGMTDTALIRYDAEGKVIGDENGIVLSHLNWFESEKRSIKSIELDTTMLKGVTGIQFSRYIVGDKVGTQEPAKTEILPLPDFETVDMYALENKPAYIKDNEFAQVKTGKFVDKNTLIEVAPYVKEYGDYHIYFEAPETWGTPETVGFHFWNSKSTPSNGDAFPNHVATKVEGKTNLYEVTIKVQIGTGFKFAIPNPKYDATVEGSKANIESGNIELTEAQYALFGNNAQIKVTLDDKLQPKVEKYLDESVEVKLVYFQDAPWWNAAKAGTTAIFYDAEDKVLTNAALGDPCEVVYTSTEANRTIRSVNAGAYPTATKVQFVRTNEDFSTDWNARTDKLALDEVNNMFVLTDDEIWHNNKNFVKTELHTYVKDTIVEPQKPEPPVSNVKTVYVYWGETTPENPTAYAFKGSAKNGEWPGPAMTAVENRVNLYKLDVDLGLYNTIIFNGSLGQTIDISLDGYKDETPVFQIGEKQDGKFTGTWVALDTVPEGTTPDPEPVVPNVKTVYSYWGETTPENLTAYAFKGAVKNAEWPGAAMTKVEGRKNLYKIDLDLNAYDNVIFNSTLGQTLDISLNGYTDEKPVFQIGEKQDGKFTGTWVALTTVPEGTTPDPEPVVPNVKTVYSYWGETAPENLTAYAFKGEVKNADWPGVAMTKVEGRKNLYKIDLDLNAYDNVIFNSTLGQTLDISLNGYTDEKPVFQIGEKQDGKFAGTWVALTTVPEETLPEPIPEANLEITAAWDAETVEKDVKTGITVTIKNSGQQDFTGTLFVRNQGTNTDKTLTYTNAKIGETAVEMAAPANDVDGFDVAITVKAGETIVLKVEATATAVKDYNLKVLTTDFTSRTVTLHVSEPIPQDL